MKIKLIIFIVILIFGYVVVDKIISAGPDSESKIVNFLRKNIDPKIRYKIKQNLFPIARYKTLLERERISNKFLKSELYSNREEIDELRKIISKDMIVKYRNGEIKTVPFKKENPISFKLKNFSYNLEIFDTNLLFNGKHDGALLGTSGYLEEFQNNTILVTGDGIIMNIDNSNFDLEKFEANIIRSNLTELITDQRVYEKSDVGIKDVLIIDNEIFLSFSNNLDECFNTAIMKAEFNFEFLFFEKFFTPNDCAKKDSGEYFFNPHSSGGKMVNNEYRNIFFTHGDYYYWPAPQNDNSHLGKILSINLKNQSAEIISKGHRNPQGLYYDINEKILISTEHGPVGGDEININKIEDKEIKNFGWPIASYGEHHCKQKYEEMGKNGYDCSDYKLAPLHKSHSKYGFEEPIKYWVPSIGVTEIVKVPKGYLETDHGEFFVGALGNNLDEGDMSLHHLTFEKNFEKVLNENVLKINQRIRDIKYSNKLNKILLFLETKGSIGVLSVK